MQDFRPKHFCNVIATEQIDWSGLRANAMHMGIRAAARASAINLPPKEQERFINRVLKRAAREGWIAAKEQAIASKATQLTTAEKPLSSKVFNGSDSLATALADDSKETKLSLSKGVRKAAAVIGRAPGKVLIKQAQNVRHIVASASTLHGWEEKQQGGFTLQVLSIGGNTGIKISRE